MYYQRFLMHNVSSMPKLWYHFMLLCDYSSASHTIASHLQKHIFIRKFGISLSIHVHFSLRNSEGLYACLLIVFIYFLESLNFISLTQFFQKVGFIFSLLIYKNAYIMKGKLCFSQTSLLLFMPCQITFELC